MTLPEIKADAVHLIGTVRNMKQARELADGYSRTDDADWRRVGRMMHVLLDIGYGPE